MHSSNMAKKVVFSLLTFCCFSLANQLNAQNVDYSVVQVPQEKGLQLVKFSSDNDYVCMPQVYRNKKGVQWYTNRIIDISPNGEELAYISERNNGFTNIFIKNLVQTGGATQRTNRGAVVDFSYSPDGKQMCFSESKGATNQIFITGTAGSFVCRQITSGNADYSPVFAPNQDVIIFARQEANDISVWAYDINKGQLSSYTTGMNPEPSKDGKYVFVSRNNNGLGEIWRINLTTGVEECILSQPEQSFFSPVLSPDGETLAVVGSSKIEDGTFIYWNTDIYTIGVNGTGLRQVTFHAADDLSPAWSTDGNSIYFVSQRGSQDGKANIWKMTYEK